jgi:hypothetical protein
VLGEDPVVGALSRVRGGGSIAARSRSKSTALASSVIVADCLHAIGDERERDHQAVEQRHARLEALRVLAPPRLPASQPTPYGRRSRNIVRAVDTASRRTRRFHRATPRDARGDPPVGG